MACFRQYMYCTAAAATYGAGLATVIGSGVVEAASLGTMTGPALAALIGGLLGMIAGLTAWIGTLMDLLDCLEAAGKTADADKVRQQVAALKGERDRLQHLVERLQALV